MKILTCYSCEGFDEEVEDRRDGSVICFIHELENYCHEVI